jgi:hypothetical protein
LYNCVAVVLFNIVLGIKVNEMSTTCVRYGGRGEVPTTFWWENLRERDLLEDLRIDTWAILNGSSRSRMGGCGLP